MVFSRRRLETEIATANLVRSTAASKIPLAAEERHQETYDLCTVLRYPGMKLAFFYCNVLEQRISKPKLSRWPPSLRTMHRLHVNGNEGYFGKPPITFDSALQADENLHWHLIPLKKKTLYWKLWNQRNSLGSLSTLSSQSTSKILEEAEAQVLADARYQSITWFPC